MRWQAEQLRLDQPVEVIMQHQATPTATPTSVAPTTGYQMPQSSITGYQMPQTATTTSVAPTTGYQQPQPSTSAGFQSAFNTFQPGYNQQQQQQLPFNNPEYQLVWAPQTQQPTQRAPVDPYSTNIPSVNSSFLSNLVSATDGGTWTSSRASGKIGALPLRPGKTQPKPKDSDSNSDDMNS
jgi:hypothetical protein